MTSVVFLNCQKRREEAWIVIVSLSKSSALKAKKSLYSHCWGDELYAHGYHYRMLGAECGVEYASS